METIQELIEELRAGNTERVIDSLGRELDSRYTEYGLQSRLRELRGIRNGMYAGGLALLKREIEELDDLEELAMERSWDV